MAATHDLIKAIKFVRERSPLALRPARDYVVGLAARNGITLAKGGCATLALVTFVGLAAAAYFLVSFL